jgi:acyl-coenzyme A thioesterase PaaI-like protein
VTLDDALGFQLTELGPEVAHAQVEIDERHLKSLGVVQGGVYAALAAGALCATSRITVAVRPAEPA